MLITLTIIGVIAALTIPNLMVKHEKQVTVTKLKKVYSTLNEAFNKIELEDPDFLESINSAYNQNVWYAIDQKLRQHLKVAVGCNRYIETVGPNCKFPTHYLLNGAVSSNDALISNVPYIILNDGTYIMFGNQGGSCGVSTSISVDLNGAKKPNMVGKDTFIFRYSTYNVHHGTSQYTHAAKLIPYGPNGGIFTCDPAMYNREILLSSNQYHACRKDKTGITCAALIIKDGWQIKDDYPW